MWLKRGQAIFRLTGGLKRFLKSSSMRIVRPLWWFHWDNILNRIYKIEKMKMLGKSDGWILTLEGGITLVISYIRFHVYPTSVQLGFCPSARGHDKWKWQLLWIMFLNQQFVFWGSLFSLFTLSVCLTWNKNGIYAQNLWSIYVFIWLFVWLSMKGLPLFSLWRPVSSNIFEN